jgi:hypothetical protein
MNSRQVRKQWVQIVLFVALTSLATMGFTFADADRPAAAVLADHTPCELGAHTVDPYSPAHTHVADCSTIGLERFYEVGLSFVGLPIDYRLPAAAGKDLSIGDDPSEAIAIRAGDQVLPDRYWEYILAELGQHMSQSATVSGVPEETRAKATAVRTVYQALPARYWEYILAELGKHMNRLVTVSVEVDTASGAGEVSTTRQSAASQYWEAILAEVEGDSMRVETEGRTGGTEYQALPQRFWEYSFSELGQHMD